MQIGSDLTQPESWHHGKSGKEEEEEARGEFRGSGGGFSSKDSGLRPRLVESLAAVHERMPQPQRHPRDADDDLEGGGLREVLRAGFRGGVLHLPETTPSSVCGRVCPHPCESGRNRKQEGRSRRHQRRREVHRGFGLEKGLKPTKLVGDGRSEKIAVVGSEQGIDGGILAAGPKGISVTVFEAFLKAGGMLRYGIPDYRLPVDILDAEIDRILNSVSSCG